MSTPAEAVAADVTDTTVNAAEAVMRANATETARANAAAAATDLHE